MALILVIEDDPNLCNVMVTLLSNQGYTCIGAASGAEALESIQQHIDQPFDLIVTDIRMEGMDGLEALERARKYLPQVGTLVISGYAGPEEISRARLLQVGGFLKKPFSMKDFLTEVQRILGALEIQRKQNRSESGLSLGQQWFFQRFIDLVDRQGLAGGARGLAHLGTVVSKLCDALGFSAERAQSLRYGLQFRQCQRTGLLAHLGGADLQFPWLPTWAFQPDSVAVGLEAELAQLIDHLWSLKPGLSVLPQVEHVDGVSAAVLQCYLNLANSAEALEEELKPAPSAKINRDNGLLALAQSLESAGDWQFAWKVYEELATASPSDLTRVQVLYRQSKLAANQGRFDISQAKFEAAEPLGQQIHAVERASHYLELAVLLDIEHPLRQRLLAEAAPIFSAAGRTLESTLVGLASSGSELSEKALLSLGEPEHLSSLFSHLEFVLPSLFRWSLESQSLDVMRLALRLGYESPGNLIRCWDKLGLESPTHETLVRALEEEAVSAPDAWLEHLEKQRSWKPIANRMRSQTRQLSQSAILTVQSFGNFQVNYGSNDVPETRWRGQKVKYLLAYLASKWGEPFHEESLVDIFWGDDAEKGEKNLYWATSTLRSCLKELGFKGNLIQRQGSHLVLNSEVEHRHDLQEFSSHYRQGNQAVSKGDQEAAYTHFHQAAQAYRAPYLDGYYGDWALQRRYDLERDHLDGLGQLSWLCFKRADYPGALEASRRILALEEENQQAHLCSMRSHLRLGDSNRAIEQFQRCEKLLKRNLGMEPSTDLLRFFQRARYGLGDED